MTERELTALVTAITASVKAELTHDLAHLTPRDGKDGNDGKDADPAVLLALQARVDTLQTVLTTQPTPRDGKDGRDGSNGRDGIDGHDADPAQLLALQARLEVLQAQLTTRAIPTLEELRPVLEAEVTRAMALRPTVKDGVSLTGALIDRAGHLVLTVSDGRTLDVGVVTGAPGPPGAPGANGTDGMAGAPGTNGTNGSNGRDAVLKGGLVLKRLDVRRFQFCWADDGTPVTVTDAAGTVIDPVIRFPVPLHKGVWTYGHTYEQDDEVIRDGSIWLAKCDTTSHPGAGASDWLLRSKRGVEGPRGKPGEPGPPGRDLTQMDFDGRKW